MVGVNFIRVNPTGEYLDINVYMNQDTTITKLLVKYDGGAYIDFTSKLNIGIESGYSKDQIVRIPRNEISSTKHLFFVRIETVVAEDTHQCRPDTGNILEVAVADTRFVYDAKVKLLKRNVANPTCLTAYMNDIIKLSFIEDMFNASIQYEQFDKASYWISQLENEVKFINDNN